MKFEKFIFEPKNEIEWNEIVNFLLRNGYTWLSTENIEYHKKTYIVAFETGIMMLFMYEPKFGIFKKASITKLLRKDKLLKLNEFNRTNAKRSRTVL